VTTATAHSNIALVKYWGKRDETLNLPAAGSLSMGLGALTTTTTVRRTPEQAHDVVVLDGAPATERAADRVSRFLDLVRAMSDRQDAVEVVTENDFPTAAGLASSASGFAALALAATTEFDLDLSGAALSALARRGSGSAARSIPGGWAVMNAGQRDDGTDAYATELAPPDHWELRCVVLVTATGEKAIGSTEGMNHTMRTSPFYRDWIDSVAGDLEEASQAVLGRDFERLCVVAERSCLRMHASALASDPGVLYWNAATTELIHRIRSARRRGTEVFFTIDAGPHVKAFCPPAFVDEVRALGEGLVVDTIVSGPGGGAKLVKES
jgi:diphosphomevalonate decarboxylase